MASPIPQKDDVERWTVEQVAAWLRQMELTDCCEFFLRKGIDGRSLMELTEEGLVLWGRDVSIRNRKKIMKLVRQIENQYLISTRKIQQSEQSPRSYDEDSESDGFASDEFDTEDDPVLHDNVHSGHPVNPDSGNEDFYMEPNPPPAPAHRTYPNPARHTLNKPTIMHGNPPYSGNRSPFVPPEKRAPMPLPTQNNVSQVTTTQNTAPLGHLGAARLPPTNKDISKRNQQLSSSSSIDFPRRAPPAVPVPPLRGSKPNILSSSTGRSSIQQRRTEFSSTQNSNQSETSGVQQRTPSYLSEMKQRHNISAPSNSSLQNSDNGNEYEVVEPSGSYMANESHSGNVTGPAPPPLPQRNQDGKDGWSANQLQSTSGPNISQSRPSFNPRTLLPTSGAFNPPSRHGSLNNNQSKSSHPSVPNPPDRQQKGFGGPRASLLQPPPEKAPPLPPPPHSLQPSPGGLQHGMERVRLEDGDSIELTPLYRSLLDRPYFHMISRRKSKELLENADDGVFLIRPSTRSSDPLTLCLRYSGRTYNINIRQRRDTLYALGSEKVNEMTFGTIDDIVHTHTNEPIKLQNGDRVTLSKSPGRGDNIYVTNTSLKKY